MGPDHVLVTVNGKRRHNSALVHLNGSVGQGTAGVDMNAIPVAAIGGIQVLRDGAAAQYGSDAIAGVIDLQLRKFSGLEFDVSTGQTSEGDGADTTVSFVYGAEYGDYGSGTLTVYARDRGRTNRQGISGIRQCPTSTATALDVPCEQAQPRDNYRIGDPDTDQLSVVYNLETNIGDGKFYLFSTYSDRTNLSGGFHRHTALTTRVPLDHYPIGYLPLIETTVDDFSVAVGYEFQAAGWDFDVSYTTGENTFDFNIKNSINASYTGVTRTNGTLMPVDSSGNAFSRTNLYEAYSGGLGFDNTILNFDAVSDFQLSNSNLNIAWGAEFRQENFQIVAGEEYSYRSYGGYNPNYCTTTNGATTCTVEYTGGIQVFPGFAPGAAVNADRDAFGLYFEADFEWENDFILNLAARFEDYSDFGDVLTAKVSGRKGLSDALAIRGSVATGFRAPSLHQIHFSAISTLSNNGVLQQTRTFANTHPVVRVMGIPALTNEDTTHLALGCCVFG